ncbi:GTA head formation protein, RCAP_rcc01685 family [Oceanomicrobium pacificus]|uniref:Gene transfer agent protein n=1 Tax=Oceanomicrobium pacificus TaxID=2692916 RepID=A0A6B0TYF7_9RHOB|nr:hypothetical protein [Oceanomicrobium pacificus]MXU66312.1 hypothetical protein [Oceanomicrobium pacificus]
MAEPGQRVGSRFLYEPFDATAARLEAQERVFAARWDGLERRLGAIEAMIERLERRIWFAVFGGAAFLAAQAFYPLVAAAN